MSFLRRGLLIAASGVGCGTLPLATGCRSAVSTHVAPDPSGTFWETKRLRGVPVTVKLPTHLDVRVVERRYLRSTETNGIKAFTPLEIGGVEFVSRHVEFQVREKDQVFLVDAVRPAAGKQTYNAEFDGQYFKEFDTRVEDKTIETVTNIVKQFTPKPPGKGSASAISQTPEVAGLTPVDRVVAAKVFEFRNPGLEADLRAFLDTYLNNCQIPCQPAPTTSSR